MKVESRLAFIGSPQEYKEQEACTQELRFKCLRIETLSLQWQEDMTRRKKKYKDQDINLQQWKDKSQASILANDLTSSQCQKLETWNEQLLLRVNEVEAKASLAVSTSSLQGGICRQCSEQSMTMNFLLEFQRSCTVLTDILKLFTK